MSLLRRSLWPLSLLYGTGLLVRDALFRLGLKKVHRLPVPVLSVGNLTVGGTGKTPMVAYLVEQARKLGLQPGVLARGYRRAQNEDLNDEGKLLRARFPDLPQVQQPDRLAGGRRLLQQHEVDLILLDDGFQHRRLHRDTDIVLVDATDPFPGGLLPAGDMREPRSALRRADLVVLTRAGGKTEADIEARAQRLWEIAGKQLAVFAADHAPSAVLSMPDGQSHGVDFLEGKKVLLLSAIARPQSFEQTARDLGCEVLGHLCRRDHHRHTEDEVRALEQEANAQSASLLVTEKDETSLATLSVPRLVLRIDLTFLCGEPTPEQLGFPKPA